MSALASPRSASWAAVAGGLGAVLLPKCPLCFAAYGSALGALGVSPAAYRPIVDALLGLGVVISFALVAAQSARRRDATTPTLSAIGAVLVLAGRLLLDEPAVTAAGAVVLGRSVARQRCALPACARRGRRRRPAGLISRPLASRGRAPAGQTRW